MGRAADALMAPTRDTSTKLIFFYYGLCMVVFEYDYTY